MSTEFIADYLPSKLTYVPCKDILLPDCPQDQTSCFRGGILQNLHSYAFRNFSTTLPSKISTLVNTQGAYDKLLDDMKRSNQITYRQYLFTCGLIYSYKQVAGTTRITSSDEVAKTMFQHLIDLIKPTCIDVKVDITGPGSKSQQRRLDELHVTGKLELAYASYSPVYTYSLVMVVEKKSTFTTPSDDSETTSQETQLLAQMAYCFKVDLRQSVLGILFSESFIVVLLMFKSGENILWTRLKLGKEKTVVNDFFAVGNDIEQLIYHSLHGSLKVEYSEDLEGVTIESTWKTCSICKALYYNDRPCKEDD